MMSLDKPSSMVQSEPSLPKPRPLGSSQPMGKRRASMGGSFRAKRRRRGNSESQLEHVLPSHFLLGGNIFDPLNLNSLMNEEVNRLTNQETPQSSPLPQRGGDPVEIVRPRDVTDPLNLKGAPQRKRRHRHRHSHSSDTGPAGTAGIAGSTAITSVNTATAEDTERAASITADFSPLWCELNTALTCREDLAPPSKRVAQPPHRRHTHPPLRGNRRQRSSSCIATATAKSRQPICFETPQTGGVKPATSSRLPCRPQKLSGRYAFGNHTPFYGFRGCYGDSVVVGEADLRLPWLQEAWFRGRRVLDVGCGAGHVALYVARSFSPAYVLGVERDSQLVRAANQNVRHFLSHDLVKAERARRRRGAQDKEANETQPSPEGDQDQGLNQDQSLNQDQGLNQDQDPDLSDLRSILASLSFPQSFRLSRGPLCAPAILVLDQEPVQAKDQSRDQTRDQGRDSSPKGFPHNITFLQGDYVCAGEAWPGRGMYDVIMCLGVAKWVQLQGGDESVVTLFTRAYQSLSSGGIFLLETQPWTSYCHSKRSSATTFRNFQNLRLRPENFTLFLTQTIGFSSYRLLTRTGNRRCFYLFHKGLVHRK